MTTYPVDLDECGPMVLDALIKIKNEQDRLKTALKDAKKELKKHCKDAEGVGGVLDVLDALDAATRAHGAAVDLYRTTFQAAQGGKSGITNNCDWREPLTRDARDVAASVARVLRPGGVFVQLSFTAPERLGPLLALGPARADAEKRATTASGPSSASALSLIHI